MPDEGPMEGPVPDEASNFICRMCYGFENWSSVGEEEELKKLLENDEI